MGTWEIIRNHLESFPQEWETRRYSITTKINNQPVAIWVGNGFFFYGPDDCQATIQFQIPFRDKFRIKKWVDNINASKLKAQ